MRHLNYDMQDSELITVEFIYEALELRVLVVKYNHRYMFITYQENVLAFIEIEFVLVDPINKKYINLETSDNSNIFYNTCSLLLTNCSFWHYMLTRLRKIKNTGYGSSLLSTPNHDLKKRLLESTQFNST